MTKGHEQADLAALDHWPVCPRCNDLREPGSVVCVECGTRLIEVARGVREHRIAP